MTATAALKRATLKVLEYLGFQLVRSMDAFTAQAALTMAKEPVIFDIGAADGGVAKIYRQRFPLAFIHCFEPLPESFARLERSLGAAPRTFCHPSAVADLQGSALLNANRSTATSSLLRTDGRGASFWGGGVLDTSAQVTVQTTTVDAFCAAARIEHIDILKMDVQGLEYAVLQGARGMLAQQRVTLVYTELIVCPTYQGQRKLHEYFALFDGLGYDLVDFFNPIRRRGQLLQTDAIFIAGYRACDSTPMAFRNARLMSSQL